MRVLTTFEADFGPTDAKYDVSAGVPLNEVLAIRPGAPLFVWVVVHFPPSLKPYKISVDFGRYDLRDEFVGEFLVAPLRTLDHTHMRIAYLILNVLLPAISKLT